MVEFITGASGTGKTTQMFSRIKKAAESGREQCIIVPEQYSYEFDKKLYYYLGAESFNELFSLSFTGLARQLFQLFGEPDRNGEYADEMAEIIVTEQAVASARNTPGMLSYFRRQSERPGFADEVMKLISELERSGVTPQQLSSRAGMLDSRLMDKTNDVAAIYYEYERIMEEYGFKDKLEDIREAAKAAALNNYFRGKYVYLDEFESFTGDQLEMLEVIISEAEYVCITLRTDDPEDDGFSLFESVNDTYRRIRQMCRELHCGFSASHCDTVYRFRSPELEYLSRALAGQKLSEDEEVPEPKHITLFEARDMYAETEYVCAAIKRLLCENKELRFRDIAVLSNSIEQNTDVFKAACGRYDIPCFMSMERPVSNTPVMVYFNTLLDIASSVKFRTEQLLRLLKCGLSDIELTQTALLETYCYQWNIDRNRWEAPFTGKDDQLDIIEALRKKVTAPLIKLKKQLRQSSSAEDICRHLYEYLISSGIDKRLAGLMEQLIRQNKDYEASELKRIWDCLMDILDTAAETLSGKEISFAELAPILRAMVGRLSYSEPPQTLDSVIAASARTARLSSPRVIFVMGATEGDFPNQVSLHGLFSEADKQELKKKKIELSRPVTELIASERLIVYKALSTASERLYISYPRSDLSGQAKYPARSVELIKELFGKKISILTSDMLKPDYYAVTMRSAYYHYMQNRKKNTPEISSLLSVLSSDPDNKRRIAAVFSRSGHKLESSIDSSLIEKLKNMKELRISSTALENWNKCRFMYFCTSVLKLSKPERMGLDVRIAGDIGHRCFEMLLSDRSREQFFGMKAEEIKESINKTAREYVDKELSGEFGKDARFTLILDKLTERLSDVAVHTQRSLMASSFIPSGFEKKIKGEHSLRLEYAENRYLDFIGIVDRADLFKADGKEYLRIIDYKSGKKSINENNLANGINLQMLLYLFALCDSRGEYAGSVPAGVLYTPLLGTDGDPMASRSEAEASATGTELKSSGLIMSDRTIFEAMEHGVNGVYIPVSSTQKGDIAKRSSCVSPHSMERLREFTYTALKDMASGLLSGDITALPLADPDPCKYCSFSNICGHDDNSRRTAAPEKILEAASILEDKGDINDNGEEQ